MTRKKRSKKGANNVTRLEVRLYNEEEAIKTRIDQMAKSEGKNLTEFVKENILKPFINKRFDDIKVQQLEGLFSNLESLMPRYDYISELKGIEKGKLEFYRLSPISSLKHVFNADKRIISHIKLPEQILCKAWGFFLYNQKIFDYEFKIKPMTEEYLTEIVALGEEALSFLQKYPKMLHKINHGNKELLSKNHINIERVFRRPLTSFPIVQIQNQPVNDAETDKLIWTSYKSFIMTTYQQELADCLYRGIYKLWREANKNLQAIRGIIQRNEFLENFNSLLYEGLKIYSSDNFVEEAVKSEMSVNRSGLMKEDPYDKFVNILEIPQNSNT